MTARNKTDHRLLTLRRKTVLEMKPDYFWDAAYGCTEQDDSACEDGDYVKTWAAVRGGVTLAQTNIVDYRPVWLAEGISQRPCLLFRGDNYLHVTPCPMAAATVHTIAIAYQMLGHVSDPAETQSFLVASEEGDSADSYFQLAVSSATKRQFTSVRADAVQAGATGTADVNTDAEVHVGVFSVNEAGDAWQHYLDGVAENMNAIGSGNSGLSFGDITTLTRLSVGGFSSTGAGAASYTLYGKIAYIAMWSKRL